VLRAKQQKLPNMYLLGCFIRVIAKDAFKA